MPDVLLVAGDQIIDRDHLVPFGDEAIGEMATDETGATSQYNTHFDPLKGR
jgi:hypothetical protein